MTVQQRCEKALELRSKGYNCAQSVACAFSDVIGADEKFLFRACEGFGRGIGDMNDICGALSGGVMAAGCAVSSGDAENSSKGSTYAVVSEMKKQFLLQNSSVKCRDLKGADTGKALRSCSDCITDAVIITEKLICG